MSHSELKLPRQTESEKSHYSVKGVILTLVNDGQKVQSAIAAISEHPDMKVGELQKKWLPVVIDSESEDKGREAHRWLESLDGVYLVDAVFTSVGDGG